MIEEIDFKGHPLISAKHRTTLEITIENYLTRRGDCIIGIEASKSAFQLDEELKRRLREEKKVLFILVVDEETFQFYASGHKDLKINDDKSIVIRKSNFIDGRTIAVQSECSAYDLPRNIINKLKNGSKGKLRIVIIN